MLSLSRKTDYAIVSLCFLSQVGKKDRGEVVSSQRIADQFGLPLPLLMGILKDLRRAGLIRSTRGPLGGYTLVRDPSEVSLLEVVEAIEGPIRLTPCVDKELFQNALGLHEARQDDACRLQGACPVHHAITRLHHRIEGFFRDVKLADMLESSVDVPAVQLESV